MISIKTPVIRNFFTVLTVNLFLTLSIYSQSCNISGDLSVCQNDVENYTSSVSGAVYQWNAYNGIVSGVGQTISVSWNSPGTGVLTLVVKDSLNQVLCTESLNVTISEVPNPIIYPSFETSCNNEIAGQNPGGDKEDRNPCYSVCDSTWITYTTEDHAGSTYSWTVTGSAIVVPSTSNEIQVYWTGTGTGLVEVAETDADTCVGYHEICVEIVAKPNAEFTTIPAAVGGIVNVCLNQDVLFVNDSDPGAGSPLWSYTWAFGDGNTEIIDASTSNGNTSYNYAGSGTYNAMLIVENECHCKDTAFITIVVDNQPGPSIECVSTVCPGSTVTYFTDAGCPNYNWTATNGTIIGDSTASEVTVTWGSATPAYLSVETDGCSGQCSTPTTVEIPVIDPNATINGPTLVCGYSCADYSITCNIPVDSIVWHFPSGVTITSDTINEHEVNVCFNDASFTGGQIVVEYYHETPGSLNELACGGTATLDIEVKPKLFINYPTEICDSTVLTGSHSTTASGSLEWTITDASGTTYLTSVLPASTLFQPLWIYGPGIFKITVEDLSSNYCNAPQSAIVKVNELPAPPDSIFGPNPVCPNVPYEYYAFSNAANYSVEWAFENGNPTQAVGQSASIIWENITPYVISASQVNPITGCKSTANIDTISPILPLSPSLISGNDTVCANGQQAYSTSSPGDDFVWSISPEIAGSVVSGQHEEDIVVEWNNYTGPATITLVRTACDQSIVTDFDVQVIAPPVPIISVPAIVCEGVEVTMSASATGATFTWDFGDGFTDVGTPVNHTYNTSGNKIVTVQANYSGSCTGSASAVASIMVNPEPNITISTPDPNLFCGTVSPVNMFVASPITGTSYDWYTSTSGSVLSSGTSYTSSTIGSYYVVGENSFGCIDTSNFIGIDTSCTEPCIPQAGSFVDFNRTRLDCNVDSFAGSFSSWAASPVYTFDDPFSGMNVASGPDAVHTFSEPGFYRVKLCVKVPNSDNSDSCTICTTKVDTINYIPDFIDSIYCINGSDSLEVKFINNTKVLSTAPVPGYEWTIDSGPVISTDTDPVLAFVPGTYLITLIVDGDCEISKTIVIDDLPDASILSVDSICVDVPIQFNSSTSGTIISSEWSFGDGASSLVSSPVKTFNPDGVYTVSLLLTNSYGCTDSSSKDITVLPNTLSATISSLNDTSFCSGDSTVLQSNVSNGYPAYNYLWSTVETSPSISALYTGQYYLEVDDSKGCWVRSNSINVFANPTPLPKIAGNEIVCLNESETFAVNYPDGLYSIEWTLNGTVISWATQSTYNFYANVLGNNSLIVKVTSPDSCIAYDTIKIKVVDNPNVSIASTGALCEGDIHLLEGNSTSTTIIHSFWNNGTINDTLFASLPGAYTYTVVDSFGCSAEAVENIYPLPDFCGLLTGCYEICDTVTELVWHAPQGYASYQWLYNGSPISGSTYDTLHVPLYQSGIYQVKIGTINGCTAISDSIDISFVECTECGISVTDSIECGPVNENGYQTYTVWFEIDNSFGPGAIVNIYSMQGSITGITPSVIPLGVTTVSATFTDLPPVDTAACFNITLSYNNERCDTRVCSDLPDCSSACEFSAFNSCVHCKEKSDSAWVYNIELTISNPFSSSANVSVLPIAGGTFGAITPNPVPPGLSNINIPFTDTPPRDSIICFKLQLEHQGRICEHDICVYLPDCQNTSLDSEIELSHFSVYPNPASQWLKVSYNMPNETSGKITIKDVNGKEIYYKEIFDQVNTLSINVENYSTGVYFIEIQNSTIRKSLPLIIQEK